VSVVIVHGGSGASRIQKTLCIIGVWGAWPPGKLWILGKYFKLFCCINIIIVVANNFN